KFDPSRDDLVGSDKKYHQNYLRFKKEFPGQDDLVVLAESENTEKNRQFVERLGAKLEAETNLFMDVFYKGDLKMMGPKALLFASEADVKGLRHELSEYLPFIQKFTQATNLVSLFQMVNFQFLHARNETNAENDSLIKAVPILGRMVGQATAALQRSGTPPSPGVEALFSGGAEAEQEIYITFGHGRIFLATAHARTEALNDAAVERLRVLVAQVQREVPGINVGVTGEPVLEHDEMLQSQKDTAVASVVSLVACALIFIYGYQETGRPIKATVCLLVGLGYTMAFTTLAVGHLNILTITFAPMLIGLAIDFGVHLITRYEEELRLGRAEEAAMRKAMVFTGQGILTGALTTGVAFLAMILTNFKGIQEMGLICGGGILICFLPMMTMLPVMLFRGRQNEMDRQPKSKVELRSKIENLWLRRPISVTLITLVLCALSVSQFHKVYFDYDLLHMQSKGLPAVVFEEKLIYSEDSPADSASEAGDQQKSAAFSTMVADNPGRQPVEFEKTPGDSGKSPAGSASEANAKPKSVLFAAVVADTAQQAVELEKKLKALPSVFSVESMAGRLTEDQTAKLNLIGEVKQEVEPIHFQPVDLRPVNIEELSHTLYSTAGYLGAAADEAQHDDPALAKQLREVRDAITELRRKMLEDSTASSPKLAEFQQALFNDVSETFAAIRNQDDREPLRVQDLPPALRNRFIGLNGKYLLQVYPKEDVWQRANQEKFVKELRTVDPNVTGTPVQLYEYTTLLKNSYQQAAWYSLAAIIIMVLVHFRTLSSVILSLLPVAVGSIWLGGLMGAFGIPFNPANIMTLPLVIGIGVTNGIHILNRFAEERNPGILAKSTGKAVFVSGLTAIAGFGSLMLAKHQGIRSLGYVMSLGVALCMIAGLTLLPAVLNLWAPWRGSTTKRPSGDNARSTLGQEEPR
ncbi:MAG TPA: MMPL family transporter, partial [Verrucomicrobiae bacterium]|nr:MMPL family transporter [Verrucomicrobiae bacterium]